MPTTFSKSSQEEKCEESSTQIKRSRKIINNSGYITSTPHISQLKYAFTIQNFKTTNYIYKGHLCITHLQYHTTTVIHLSYYKQNPYLQKSRFTLY